MSVAVCARCGQSAVKRVRWFVAGRDMPMFDVCWKHMDAEVQTATVLNRGWPNRPLRVRVTDLPEQLRLPSILQGWGVAAAAALRLYRSCRERDFLPWEALDYVQAELQRVMQEGVALGRTGQEMDAVVILDYLVTYWRPVVERWRARGAEDEARTDRLRMAVSGALGVGR